MVLKTECLGFAINYAFQCISMKNEWNNNKISSEYERINL